MRTVTRATPLAIAGRAVGWALAGLAWARGGRAVHPHGAVHRARLVVDGAAHAPAAAVLATAAEYPALVRFSRSFGLPRPLTDLLGLSLRVLGAYGPERHQDFLLISSFDLPVLHHVFVPSGDVQRRPYSSLLPYRAGDATFIVGAVPDPRSPRPGGLDEFDRLARAAWTGRLTFGLAVASAGGRFRRVGTIHVGDRMAGDAVRMHPFNCGGGLRPVGAVNRLREHAYTPAQQPWTSRRA